MCNSTIVARVTHRPHLVIILARAPVLQPAAGLSEVEMNRLTAPRQTGLALLERPLCGTPLLLLLLLLHCTWHGPPTHHKSSQTRVQTDQMQTAAKDGDPAVARHLVYPTT